MTIGRSRERILSWKDAATRVYFSKRAMYVYGIILFLNIVLLLAVVAKWHVKSIHILELILTVVLWGEVILRILVVGSVRKYLQSADNVLDLAVAVVSSVYKSLLCEDFGFPLYFSL